MKGGSETKTATTAPAELAGGGARAQPEQPQAWKNEVRATPICCRPTGWSLTKIPVNEVVWRKLQADIAPGRARAGCRSCGLNRVLLLQTRVTSAIRCWRLASDAAPLADPAAAGDHRSRHVAETLPSANVGDRLTPTRIPSSSIGTPGDSDWRDAGDEGDLAGQPDRPDTDCDGDKCAGNDGAWAEVDAAPPRRRTPRRGGHRAGHPEDSTASGRVTWRSVPERPWRRALFDHQRQGRQRGPAGKGDCQHGRIALRKRSGFTGPRSSRTGRPYHDAGCDDAGDNHVLDRLPCPRRAQADAEGQREPPRERRTTPSGR